MGAMPAYLWSVCLGWILANQDGGLAAPDVAHLFSVPFLTPLVLN